MESNSSRSLAGVTGAEHAGEGHDLLLAAATLAGFLGVTLEADVLDDVFAVELLLHAAERTIDGLIFAHLDLNRHV